MTDIVVGMSGGVDSSVSALLLKQQGHDVAGLFMKNWEEDDHLGVCPAEADALDAERVCQHIGITLHTRNFAAEYWDHVFEHFLAEYRAGRTPNPDILCNREIKFKTFIDHAEDLGVSSIATGHYVRRRRQHGQWLLCRGLDGNKDQSYFLYTLGQEQLACSHFPLGELDKTQVRQLAHEHSLHNYQKKDSTGICFIGERHFKSFLARYIPAQPGEIHTIEGDRIGQHEGLMYYTLGQRHGLGIGGLRQGTGAPWYVAHKALERNVLHVVQGHDHPYLMAQSLTATDVTWVAGQAPAPEFTCRAKIRYRQADRPCQVQILDQQRLQVRFDHPQWAVTPGQSVVFYHDEVCLGGAVIESTDSPAGQLDDR